MKFVDPDLSSARFQSLHLVQSPPPKIYTLSLEVLPAIVRFVLILLICSVPSAAPSTACLKISAGGAGGGKGGVKQKCGVEGGFGKNNKKKRRGYFF